LLGFLLADLFFGFSQLNLIGNVELVFHDHVWPLCLATASKHAWQSVCRKHIYRIIRRKKLYDQDRLMARTGQTHLNFRQYID